MAKKSKGNTAVRFIHPDIWDDAKVQALVGLQFKMFIFAFSAPQAGNTNFGIYEVTEESMAGRFLTTVEEVKLTLKFFNKKRPSMIKYDFEHKILFCVNFLKYQSRYLSTWKGFIACLLFDWKNTREKVPHFWKEFYLKNKDKIHFMNEAAKNDEENLEGVNLDEFIEKTKPEKPLQTQTKPDSLPDLFEQGGVYTPPTPQFPLG